MRETKEGARGSVWLLLGALFSFLGWAMETVFVRMTSGVWTKRGFLSLPMCPIYGVCIVLANVVCERIFCKTKGEKWQKNLLCLAVCGCVPTLAELIVGWGLDKMYHVKLWTYSSWRYNVGGYICLPVSLIWCGLLFVTLRYVLPFFKTKIERLPQRVTWLTALFFTALAICDGMAQFLQMTGAGMR